MAPGLQCQPIGQQQVTTAVFETTKRRPAPNMVPIDSFFSLEFNWLRFRVEVTGLQTVYRPFVAGALTVCNPGAVGGDNNGCLGFSPAWNPGRTIYITNFIYIQNVYLNESLDVVITLYKPRLKLTPGNVIRREVWDWSSFSLAI
jgi:hypothetical protein